MKWQRYINWLSTTLGGHVAVAAVVLAIILAGLGMRHLELASDYKIFFDDDDLELQQLEDMQAEYTASDNVFIMISAPGDTIYEPSSIELVHRLTTRLWQVPYATRVDSLTNYTHSFAVDDDIFIEQLVYDETDINEETIASIARLAPSEPDLRNKLVSSDGRFAGINATISLPGLDHQNEILKVTDAVSEVVADFQAAYPEHRIYVTGIVAMNGAFFEAAKRDLVTLIPLMMLLVLVAAGLVLRSARAAFIMLVVVLCAFAASLGLSGWLGIKLSAPSISAPIIMFTVVVASSIHIITYVVRHIARAPGDPIQAVAESYQHNGNAVVLSHVTTIIGFVSMNWSDSPPFRDLGNVVAIGVGFSLVLIVTLLPFLLKFLRSGKQQSVATWLDGFTHAWAEMVIRNRLAILWIVIPVTLAVGAFSIRSSPNDNLIGYFAESVPFRQHADAIDLQFSGIYTIDYSIVSDADNGIFKKDYLAFVGRFEQWLLDQPEVVTVDSLLHRIKDLNQLIHGDDPAFYTIPENDMAAAQTFLMYEMSLPFGMEPTNQANLNKSALRITARLRNQGSQPFMDFERRTSGWLTANIPASLTFEYTSPAVIFSHVGQTSIVSLIEGSFIALLVICLLFLFIFRSPKIALLSLIPNVLPIATAFGVWYFLHGEISMGLAGVSAMAIGVVVDDSVHFLYQYIGRIKRGLSPEDSVRRSFEHTVRAILISSILLIVGFLLLSTSSFEKNAQMGVLTSVTILFALLLDTTLLPAMLMTFVRGQNFKRKFNSPAPKGVNHAQHFTD